MFSNPLDAGRLISFAIKQRAGVAENVRIVLASCVFLSNGSLSRLPVTRPSCDSGALCRILPPDGQK